MSKADRNNRYYHKHRERILADNMTAYWSDPEAARAAQRLWKSSNPVRAALAQTKASAKRINVPFNLTFEEFSDMWNGEVGRRGRTLDALCLYRYADEGIYESGNVYIATLSEHAAGART